MKMLSVVSMFTGIAIWFNSPVFMIFGYVVIFTCFFLLWLNHNVATLK